MSPYVRQRAYSLTIFDGGRRRSGSLRMGIGPGVACQSANGCERLPQDSICAQAHIGVILCRVAFRRESIIVFLTARSKYALIFPLAHMLHFCITAEAIQIMGEALIVRFVSASR